MKWRIGIVDDHPAIALGVASIINAQRSLLLVGFGTTVDELLGDGGPFDLVLPTWCSATVLIRRQISAS